MARVGPQRHKKREGGVSTGGPLCALDKEAHEVPCDVGSPEKLQVTTYYRQYGNIYLNINQLDALNFIMSLFHASTCFEHMCSSSRGQNCTIQSLVSSHL